MIRLRPSMWMIQARRFWARTGLVFAILALGGPPVALGQQSEVQVLLKHGQQAGVDVEQMRTVAKRARKAGLSTAATASLLRPAVKLAEQDLPASPLLTKALEGLAKRVPHARMQPVLNRLRTHIERAGQIVSQWLQRPEVQQFIGATAGPPNKAVPNKARTRLVTAIAEAQQQDIPAKTIDSFLNTLPSAVNRRPVSLPEVATAVNVLPELPGSKTSPKAATQLLTAALNAGYSPESLRQLPVALRSARRTSQRPAVALVRRTAQAIARGTPAADVLRGLFQGSLPGGGPPTGIGPGPPGKGPGAGKLPGRGGKPPGTGPPNNPPGGPPNNPPGGGGPPG